MNERFALLETAYTVAVSGYLTSAVIVTVSALF